MKHKTKLSVSLILISGFLLLILLFGYYMAPGSYPKAEVYKLNTSEKELINIINEVKKENNFLLYNNERDYGRKHGHWNSFYFIKKDIHKTIHTWTRPISKNETSFAFVEYRNNESHPNWISANEYFWWWKNSKEKTKFELQILNKIKEKIRLKNH